jgi:hypothetical protein
MAGAYLPYSQKESALCFGNEADPAIILIQPFFEEGNRVRNILTQVMRTVSNAGFRTILPDLPGCGESLIPLRDVTLEDWHSALKACAAKFGQPKMVASFRTGALIDTASSAAHIWRCSPETGARMVRDLMRTRLTSTAQTHGDSADTITLAGNQISKSLIDALQSTAPAPHSSLRIARLSTEAAEADVRLDGSPVWRRSEPGDDPLLRASITQDLISWAKSCAAA